MELQYFGGMKLEEDGRDVKVKPKGKLGRIVALTYELYENGYTSGEVNYGLLGKMKINKNQEEIIFKPTTPILLKKFFEKSNHFKYKGKEYKVRSEDLLSFKKSRFKFSLVSDNTDIAEVEMRSGNGTIRYEEEFDIGKEILVGYGIWAMSWYAGFLGR
ncbi:MAG: hypothetical protein ACW981_16615 [Candidatus Hodarchaeales archaeon]